MQRQQKEEKNKQEKWIPLTLDYFSPSYKRRGQNEALLLSRAKSLLGDKHPKTKTSSQIKHSFPQSKLLHFLSNVWFPCNFVQKFLEPTTLRTNLDLKSGSPF